VWGLSLGLLAVNLMLAIFGLNIGFFSRWPAYLYGFAFGIACASYQLFAGLYARARIEQIPETIRDRIRGSLAMKTVLVLTIAQFFLGTAAIARGVSGLYVSTAGEKTVVTFQVKRVHWNSRRSQRCFEHELEGLDAFSNATSALCLDVELKAGTKLIFRGRQSSLGMTYDQFSVAPDSDPEGARGLRNE
jgi:hypothetical protein